MLYQVRIVKRKFSRRKTTVFGSIAVIIIYFHYLLHYYLPENASDDLFFHAKKSKIFQPELVHNCSAFISKTASKSKLWDASTSFEHKLNYENEGGSWGDDFDCEHYINTRLGGFFWNDFSSSEEKSFPLAYTIIAYHNFDQLEQLLLSIYRPHNFYCLQIDSSALEEFKQQVEQLVSCIADTGLSRRLFLSFKPLNIHWGRPSLLKAELGCMRDLVFQSERLAEAQGVTGEQGSTQWKYLINLTGEEFPLVTNKELVSVLSRIRGANILDGGFTQIKPERYPETLPFNLSKYKSSTHFLLNRKAVEFIIADSALPKLLYKALHRYNFLEESFFAILQYNPRTLFPGGMLVEPETNLYTNQNFPRYKVWRDKVEHCPSGMTSRDICVMGINDLPALVHEAYGLHFFVNKFYWDYQPAAWDCINVWHHLRSLEELESGSTSFNPFVFVNSSYMKYTKPVRGF